MKPHSTRDTPWHPQAGTAGLCWAHLHEEGEHRGAGQAGVLQLRRNAVGWETRHMCRVAPEPGCQAGSPQEPQSQLPTLLTREDRGQSTGRPSLGLSPA